MIEELHTESLKKGLKMNFSKTKLISYKDNKSMINIEGTEIEHVGEYTYLGQKVKVSKENQTTEISRRVKMGWAAFGRLLYEAQTWTFTKINMDKIKKLRELWNDICWASHLKTIKPMKTFVIEQK
ncbi:unnamed protein product [Diabrotica balteata]|uniref:Reverse transcriptase n=1 Tax=Diabrotica balteata TaxID=107213 RepID=A0A9N9ST60_DIABA|nr:unnamed protein product [Diabrotica balteata]